MDTSLIDSVDQEDVFDDEALEPIAIIAMTGRFPGAANVEKFWENLRDGVESVRVFSDQELRSQVDEALLKNPNFVGADAVLDDIDLFDAEFFGYTPREAEIMESLETTILHSLGCPCPYGRDTPMGDIRSVE